MPQKTGTTKYNHSVPNKNVLHVLMTFMFFPCTTIAQKVLANVILFWGEKQKGVIRPYLGPLSLIKFSRSNIVCIWHKRTPLPFSFISRSRSGGCTCVDSRGALLIEMRRLTLNVTYWPYGLYQNACFDLKNFLI